MHVRPLPCAHARALPALALAHAVALALGCGAQRNLPSTPAAHASPSTSVARDPASASSPRVELPPGWPFGEPASPPTSAKGMVATDAELATKVGADVLAAGGNAVDAAVATAFALAVVFPTAGNIGGGGFMVASVDGKSWALDFRETAPAAATHDMYLDPQGKPTDKSRVGHLSAGVPGSVMGLSEAHARLGSKPWKELLAPAIKLADEGLVVTPAFSQQIRNAADRLATFSTSAALFLPNGAPPAPGSRWRAPELATTLRRIAERGAKGFYEGETADLIAAEMQRGGGVMTRDDLKAYRAKWRAPIELTYRGHKITSMPPPSSGGLTLAMMCNILAPYDLKALGWHAPAELHVVFEAMRRAFAARNAVLGDPDFVKNPVDRLLSPEWAAAQRATILPVRATPSSEVVAQPTPGGGNGPHTTHFSVVDGRGNAVALTTTINLWFGSGVTVAGAGFVLNDEMDDFAAKPGTGNAFGLVQGEPNAIAPGKRMLSSMAPTIVTGPDGHVRVVLGAAGGPTIITGVFQELSNVVDFDLPIARAVAAPRFHHQHLPDVVLFEKGGVPAPLGAALSAAGYELKERPHIADAPAIGWDGKAWVGAAEPRREGGGAAGP